MVSQQINAYTMEIQATNGHFGAALTAQNANAKTSQTLSDPSLIQCTLPSAVSGASCTSQQQSKGDSIEDIVIEVPVLEPKMRGIWRSVTRQSTTVYVGDSHKEAAVAQKECEQIGEKKQQEEEDSIEEVECVEEEDIAQAVAEMKKLLKAQTKSKASKYCKIIRESVEFEMEGLEDDKEEQEDDIMGQCIDDPEDYAQVKDEVLKLLQRKIDEKNYVYQLKDCRKTAKKVDKDYQLGTGYKALKRAYKSIKNSQKK